MKSEVIRSPLRDMSGERHGSWEVIEYSHSEDSRFWLCVCRCGALSIVSSSQLTGGHSKQCGSCAKRKYFSEEDKVVALKEIQKVWRKRNNVRFLALQKSWREKHPGHWRKYQKKMVGNISDAYAAILLRSEFPILRDKDIPKPLLEAKRSHVQLKRLLKERRHGTV